MLNPHLDRRPAYSIDARDRLLCANDAWLAFHRESAPSQPVIEHRSPWRGKPAGVIRRLWDVLYARVRTMNAPLFVPMRVDTPTERRVIDLELHPLPEDCILHVYEPAWSERRAAVALLDGTRRRDAREVAVCIWCNRVRVRVGVWEEAELAERSLRLDGRNTLPSLQASSCGPCKQSVLKNFPAATHPRRAAG